MHPFQTIIKEELSNDPEVIEKVYTALNIPHEPTEKEKPIRNSDGGVINNGYDSKPD